MMAIRNASVIDPRDPREDGQTEVGLLLRPLDAKRVRLQDPVIAFPVLTG